MTFLAPFVTQLDSTVVLLFVLCNKVEAHYLSYLAYIFTNGKDSFYETPRIAITSVEDPVGSKTSRLYPPILIYDIRIRSRQK